MTNGSLIFHKDDTATLRKIVCSLVCLNLKILYALVLVDYGILSCSLSEQK